MPTTLTTYTNPLHDRSTRSARCGVVVGAASILSRVIAVAATTAALIRLL